MISQMIFFLIKIGIVCIILYLFLQLSNTKKEQSGPNLIKRFRKSFKGRNRLDQKIATEFSNSLMADPDSNIKTNYWEKDHDLRDKADIHRARLNRYGRSKMNGKMVYMDKVGRVYMYNDSGEKEYL